MDAAAYHDEVVAAFRLIGNPRYGAAVAADRRSNLTYLGVSVPQWRARTQQGFSFHALPPEEVLQVWDGLWRTSPYGEVLFAALAYYRKAPKRRPAGLWPVVREWIGRVDNWAHADELAGHYSELLEEDVEAVYPQLHAWNRTDDQWHRRISVVSLIHYTGKNAVFMPLDSVIPLVANLLQDPRHHVQTAVGWVLREMGSAYPAEVMDYLDANAAHMSAAAFSRAIERRSTEEKARLRRARAVG